MKYEFDKTDEGWRAIAVCEDGSSRAAVGPAFATQTEAVLYTFQLHDNDTSPEQGPKKPVARSSDLETATVCSERGGAGAKRRRSTSGERR